jgi:phosphoserine phosphatase RsbU/P
MSSAPLLEYRNIIDSFKAKRLTDHDVEQRLSDLMLFLDFSYSLNRASGVKDIANLILLTLMGYTASRRAVFLKSSENGLEVLESKGCRNSTFSKVQDFLLPSPYPEYHLFNEKQEIEWNELCDHLGVRLIVPVHHEQRLVALVGLGETEKGKDYTPHQIQIIVSLVLMCTSALENAANVQSLHELNRQLGLKIYQLNTLFELSKDFNAVWDSETIFRILGSSLIGQLLISRCAVFQFNQSTPELRFLRGFRLDENDMNDLKGLDVGAYFKKNSDPVVCAEISDKKIADFLLAQKIHMVYPITLNDDLRGLILLGEKKNRNPFTREDFEFISTLGNLAIVSDENAQMQQQMIEKQRMEKELTIAREIQFSLLPQMIPQKQGYEIASVFIPCYTVGGDYYDFLTLSAEEMGIAIGDVSGKSTPAAMLMASVQASLQTLASLKVTDPEVTIQHINQLLCRSPSNKYVTFFYGILNHRTNRLTYVNAGHCYPLILKKNGRLDRLEIGGTVLGFFREAIYTRGTYDFESGDLMILYTDGVSELINPEEEEFGAERIVQTLRECQPEPVSKVKSTLVRKLEEHRHNQPQFDDLTFVLLKRI